MLDRPAERRVGKVADLVGEILAKHSVPGPVAPDAELAKLGLTSIDMVELMLAVEAEFDVIIPPPDITTENFRSIESIDRLIGKLDAATVAASR
jgi:acyl carrier protein